MRKFDPTTLDFGILSISLYVSAQLISNVLSVKITTLPFVSWAVDGGTIIYPLTFTLRDFVHKTWGKKKALQVVVVAALMNLMMVALFFFVSHLPSDASWGSQEAFEAILLPVWRITLASIVAQVISEIIDTEIFSSVFKLFGDLPSVLLSNTVALLADSVIFSVIAFIGVLPTQAVLQIIGANIIIKLLLSFISSPLIKMVPRNVPLHEI